VPLPNQKLASKNCALLIQKSAAKNLVAANSYWAEKLQRCRFKNQQPIVLLIQKSVAKNYALLIQKSTAKNFVQESGAEWCRCRFKNRQPTVSLPI